MAGITRSAISSAALGAGALALLGASLVAAPAGAAMPAVTSVPAAPAITGLKANAKVGAGKVVLKWNKPAKPPKGYSRCQLEVNSSQGQTWTFDAKRSGGVVVRTKYKLKNAKAGSTTFTISTCYSGRDGANVIYGPASTSAPSNSVKVKG